MRARRAVAGSAAGLSARATAAGLAILALALAGCGPDGPGNGAPAGNSYAGADSARVSADTVDPALTKPGTVFRFGPAEPEVAAGPVYPPVVVGDAGQVSIYEGFFLVEACARPLRADASRAGDTIVVRVISEPDTARASCQEERRPTGYAMLVGQFEPGGYPVRLIHEGDLARDAPLDTVYENITVEPNPR